MVSEDIRQLLDRDNEGQSGPSLSVYLSVGQSAAVSRNRKFESTLKTLLQPLEAEASADEATLESLQEASKRCGAFVDDYKPKAKTLVLLSEPGSGFFWGKGLQVPMREQATWGSKLHLRPLLEALDEHERYGLVLMHRGRARLFLAHMDELEETAGIVEQEVRRYKKVGTDHWRSQANFERNADHHAASHGRRVVELLLEAERDWSLDRLIIAGGLQARRELRHALPRRLASKVVATPAMPIDASQEQVLEAIRKTADKAERQGELRIVRGLITRAAKGKGAVAGLDATVEALAQGKIHKVVYAEDFRADRAACLECGAMSRSQDSQCSRCGAKTTSAPPLLDEIVSRVDQTGGMVEIVRGEPAKLLNRELAGIGALLRY